MPVTINPDFPRLAAEAATRISGARDPRQAAILATCDEIAAMAAVCRILLRDAYQDAPRWSNEAAQGRPRRAKGKS